MRIDIRRLFDGSIAKGSANYIRIQRKYELARTILFFVLSASIFLIGFLSTHSKRNLLTIVAVLGVLPAAKSFVSFIMFCKFKGCRQQLTDQLASLVKDCPLVHSFDRVFTTYDKNYEIEHLLVYQGDIIGFLDMYKAEKKDFDMEAFEKHIDSVLKAEGQLNKKIYLLKEESKYLKRVEDIVNHMSSEYAPQSDMVVLKILKDVSL